jgi:hypothetical protein
VQFVLLKICKLSSIGPFCLFIAIYIGGIKRVNAGQLIGRFLPDDDLLSLLHFFSPPFVSPCEETVPVAISCDTPQTKQRFSSFTNPAHSTTIHALPNHIACRPLHDARRHREVFFGEPLVMQHVETKVHRVDELTEGVSFALVAFGPGG